MAKKCGPICFKSFNQIYIDRSKYKMRCYNAQVLYGLVDFSTNLNSM